MLSSIKSGVIVKHQNIKCNVICLKTNDHIKIVLTPPNQQPLHFKLKGVKILASVVSVHHESLRQC